jgi:hypothetical protein
MIDENPTRRIDPMKTQIKMTLIASAIAALVSAPAMAATHKNVNINITKNVTDNIVNNDVRDIRVNAEASVTTSAAAPAAISV